jgi:hypothetical protein
MDPVTAPKVSGVSAVVNPIGPQPSSVYWRRRLVALIVVLVPIAILLRACVFDADPSSTTTPPDTTTPTVEATATPTEQPTATTSPTSAPTTPSPTATSAQATSGEVVACSDDEIAVTTVVAQEQFPVGGPVPIRFAVRTTGSQPCTRDVGAAQNTVLIRSEGRRIWSSDDCTPGGDADVRTLVPGESFAVTVTWQGDISDPDCDAVRPKAPSGSYEVVGRNGAVIGQADAFTLG